jgi:hypothetical protein
VQVIISRRDLQSEEDTKLLMEETCKVKPVGGIFHLAMVSFIFVSGLFPSDIDTCTLGYAVDNHP